MPNPKANNPRYEIVTPDGWTFEFRQPDYAVDVGFFDGGELPPIQHSTQVLYKQPGALLQSIAIQPRVVTITGALNAKTRTELHEIHFQRAGARVERVSGVCDDPGHWHGRDEAKRGREIDRLRSAVVFGGRK